MSYSQEIHEWLVELCPEVYNPPYKFTEPQKEMLKNLRDLYIDCEADADIVIEILETLKHTYKIKAEKSAKQLQLLNIKWEDLPDSEKRLLQEISECQEGLELQEFNETSIKLCKSDKSYKRLELEFGLSRMSLETKMLDTTIRKYKEASDKLNDIILLLKKEIPPDCEPDKSLLDDYKKQMQVLQENINRLELKSTEQPKYVVDLIAEINSLKEQIQQEEKELASYKDLPPSVLLAQRTVHESQKHLARLQEKIARKVLSS